MGYAYLKKGTWYVGFKDENGRARQQATKARSKTEAKRIAAAEEQKAERVAMGLETRTEALTLGQLWEKWAEAKGSLASHETDEQRWRSHLKDKFGNVAMKQLQPAELEIFLRGKLKSTLNPTGLSVQTVRHLRLLIGRMFRWAVKKDLWRGINPAEKVELPKLIERSPQAAKPADVVTLLEIAEEPYRTIFAVGVYAGLRSAEILGLEVPHVNLAAGLILVSKQSTRETTKSGKWRAVPIVAELRAMLEARIKAFGPGYDGKIFPFPWGHPRQHILRTLKAYLKKAGLDPALTIHALRHTFISQLIMSGADPRAVQALAGHSSFTTTQRYVHLKDHYLVQQVAKLSYAGTASPALAERGLPSAYPMPPATA